MSDRANEDILARLRTKMPPEADLDIPPKVFEDMGGTLLRYVEGEKLVARFPVEERYQNPMGYVQGGIIVAVVDNTLGPLSYLVAPPSVTTNLDTSFIRPVGSEETYLEVEGCVVERAGRQLFMTARVTNLKGKTVALSHARCQIVNRGRRT